MNLNCLAEGSNSYWEYLGNVSFVHGRVPLVSEDVMNDAHFSWRRQSEPWPWHMVVCESCRSWLRKHIQFTIAAFQITSSIPTVLHLWVGNHTLSFSQGLGTKQLGFGESLEASIICALFCLMVWTVILMCFQRLCTNCYIFRQINPFSIDWKN